MEIVKIILDSLLKSIRIEYELNQIEPKGGFSIPVLCENKEKQKALFLQMNRCGGCHLCVEVCPKEVLEKSEQLNLKVQYPPKVKEGAECSFCQTCELVCPDFAIYVLKDENYQELLAIPKK